LSEGQARIQDFFPSPELFVFVDPYNGNAMLYCSWVINPIVSLERFSIGCRKVTGFAFTTLDDRLKKLAPLFHPIRSKTKTTRDYLARVFPRFASATCNCFEFWLVHCILCAPCDWLEWLLWLRFYDTWLKTALTGGWDGVYYCRTGCGCVLRR